MKTIEELKKQEPLFLEDWSESKLDGLLIDFFDINRYNDTCDNLVREKKIVFDHDKINVLIAYYTYANYSGSAWVLFEQDGKLYEVNGSHCSCYGLEGQWCPEETDLETIKFRINEGELGKSDWNEYNYQKEIKEFLGL